MRTPNQVGVVIYQQDGKWYASLVHSCGYVARPLIYCGLTSRRAVVAALAESMAS
jgi:hypothetical protein